MMEIEQFSQEAKPFYSETYQVLVSKQKDYGPLNIARAPGGPLNGLRVRMHDKLSRIIPARTRHEADRSHHW
jgi:hypothetical protein